MLLGSVNIPQLKAPTGFPVETSRCHRPAIRAERQRQESISLAIESRDVLGRSHVPQFDRTLLVSRRKGLSVWGKGQTSNACVVTNKSGLYFSASSAESVGEFWFGEVSKLVI
jgi:hypothetical protein